MRTSFVKTLALALSLSAALAVATPAAARATRTAGSTAAASVREPDPGERLQRWMRSVINRVFGVSTTADPSIPLPAPSTTT